MQWTAWVEPRNALNSTEGGGQTTKRRCSTLVWVERDTHWADLL